MKKNWKKLFSVLLLSALLCALPGTLAWGENSSPATDATPTPDVSPTTETPPSPDTSPTTETTPAPGASPSTDTTPAPDASPTAEITPAPDATSTPDPTSTPEATPTPTPTATPTPTPSKPVITKDPTDETVDVGGDCWFIAYSDAPYAVWHFVSPDGKTDYRYDAQEIAKAFPGLQIENGNRDSLHLVNIPAEMNGWRAGCEFRNDIGSVRSGYAVVHVNGAPAATPSPSPSATPAAKPSPTPTPAATTTPAPTSVPIATPSPVVSPTPEGTGEPPAALNRGGKIFLLFGAGALVVGAAAIGTILLVSKRMSAKEAYTYKNSTRRRK